MLLSQINASPIELKGIGKCFVEALKKIEIETIGQLLLFFPRDFEDRSKFDYLSETKNKDKLIVQASVIAHSWFGFGIKRTLKILIEDALGNKATLICFNRSFLQKLYPVGSEIIVIGSFYKYRNKLTSSAFNIEKKEEFLSGIVPIYKSIEGINQKKIISCIKSALDQYMEDITSDLPQGVISAYNLQEKKNVIRCMHFPNSMQEVEKARYSLIFEELFFLQYHSIIRYFKRTGRLPKLEMSSNDKMSSLNNENLSEKCKQEINFSKSQVLLTKRLKFSLTEDQITAVLEINKDLDACYPASRLLQGDVGSGKSLVAFLASLYAIEKNWQVALLAPTELLALQHAQNAIKLLSPLGVNVAFLSGNVKTRGRKLLLKELKAGNINLIIGTHAIFSKDLEYQNLKLVIIDEQHKFGVLQREALLQKGMQEGNLPNLLMMSATPIPRSLALSIFGDLDISTIKTMPAERLAIKTYIANSKKANRVYDFVKQELKKGRQAYFIYPLIENSESSSFKAVQNMKDNLSQYFSQYCVEAITSKTDEDEQKEIMNNFISGKINILVATSIVEVGVDVPNATCMVIEDAQNFPLVTLHQMRGRVGRGKDQSYCILLYEGSLNSNAYKRLKIMKESNDGFAIADEDLKIRGPGNILGMEQSGHLGFKMADPIKDYDILLKARQAAIEYAMSNTQK